jgi:hypothetical protein
MGERKEKRRGGARDESIIYINFTRASLAKLITDTGNRLGVSYPSSNSQSVLIPFVRVNALPILWRAVKRKIREHIDGWQQELPLF